MLDQIGIALTGATAVFLSQSKSEKLRRWACLFGIAGQPFWFWTAISHQQWGLLCVNFLFAFSWGKGVWINWINPRIRK